MRPNVLNYACIGAAETGKLFYGSFSAKQNRCNGVNMKQEKRNENECAVRCSPQQVQAILEGLAAAHPDAKPELNFSNPFELLIATILSAQCTDKQVNKCTAQLFKAYPDAEIYCLNIMRTEVNDHTKVIKFNRCTKAFTEYFGINLVNQYDNSGMSPANHHSYMLDVKCLHPNAAGHFCMAQTILSEMGRRHETD